MKIFSAAQIHEWDAYTIQHEPILSIDLMERASLAFCRWFEKKVSKNKIVKVFCGPGNNGGDGLAITRTLVQKGYHVDAYIICPGKPSEDFKINFDRLTEIMGVQDISNENQIPSIHKNEVVIDAIFGSGLSRPVSGLFARVVEKINSSEALVVSVDIASGLYADLPNDDSVIIKPDFTVSFQTPKLSFLLPQNEEYVGRWILIDIGLNKEFAEQQITKHFFVDAYFVKSLIRKRSKFSHKGTYGTSLIIGGSYGMVGAVVLATKACLKTGVGLSVAYVPKCAYEILQTAVPENMVKTDEEFNHITSIPELEKYKAIAIGPGLGQAEDTVKAVGELLEKATIPLVIDADALNILSLNKEWMTKIPEGSILTPHPKEFERIAGTSNDNYERLELLSLLSKKIKSVIVLKGAHTAIASPDGSIYFNASGNPGMATGGSGDVLTGIITSLVAQGYSSLHAAILGVYLHGYAGDFAAREESQESLIASDIISWIGKFFHDFSH